MSKEYVYSGDCEPTICPCGAIHPWTYQLTPCLCGQEGCYECQDECEFCGRGICEGHLEKYNGCNVCSGCKAQDEMKDAEFGWRDAA